MGLHHTFYEKAVRRIFGQIESEEATSKLASGCNSLEDSYKNAIRSCFLCLGLQIFVQSHLNIAASYKVRETGIYRSQSQIVSALRIRDIRFERE